jgi:translation initiation factor IF-3
VTRGDALIKQEAYIAGPFRPGGGSGPSSGGPGGGFRPRPSGGSFNRGGRDFHKGPRINERIRVPKIRVIGAEGEQVGIMTPQEAMKMADEYGLDLVEISPTADPPVCKIMDYGKFKYEQQKKQQESKKKQTTIALKEIKLRPNTDTHDLEFKVNHVRRFLEQKDKAKISIQFRGREMQHIDRAKETMKKIIATLQDIGEPEKAPAMEGRTLSVIIAPK